MAKIKFRSTLARYDDVKETNAVIESGGTKNFYHSKRSFDTYDEIPAEGVKGATGKFTIVGRGKVRLPIDGVIMVEAFDAPLFDPT